MILDTLAKVSKRFSYQELGTPGEYDVYASHRGETYLIAHIRNRTFKRVQCAAWKGTNSDDYLSLIQSYAGLNAAQTGKTGPL